MVTVRATHEKNSPKPRLGYVGDEPVHLPSLWPETAELLGWALLHRPMPGGEVLLGPVHHALHAAVLRLVVSQHGLQLDEEVICGVSGRSNGLGTVCKGREGIQYAVSSSLS